MLAPTYPETGAPNGQAPVAHDPVPVGQPGRAALVRAPWPTSPGPSGTPVSGMWQFDSAGLGAPFTAAQRIDTFVVSAQTAATMAARWCTNPTLAYVWAPWFGCGTSTCRNIFDTDLPPRRPTAWSG